jgi:hypothetical protein
MMRSDKCCWMGKTATGDRGDGLSDLIERPAAARGRTEQSHPITRAQRYGAAV